ncbi:uncharacterized protein EAF02_000875 [Botrytis sinoallii]|uniref:uncharacterized protein n=1 Tax=Botrytis sinoallii TaxID=1463999 RepID=UPI0018FF33E1|nr:uncharacterized protein EAF02_000875 [Botrytis sinoallii]KAF7893337.1 hypothetical protein EAF02_000875 [Botrytis sinoallii]
MPPNRGIKEASQGSVLEKAVEKMCGIIMQQLLRGPEAVSEQFQHTPEDVRRSIGPMIISEDNEILRLICGRVFALLLNADVLPEELCPVKTDEREYEDFPVDLQNLNEWKSQFQQWVDRKWPDNESQTPPHMLYYSLSVVTIPPFRLGTLGESIELVLEDGYILLLKSSTEQELDQILQVPCNSISRVSVIDNSIIINEREVYDIVFDIKNDQARSSHLNSRPTTLQQLRLTTDSNRNELMIDLHDECPEAEFQPERVQVSQAEDDILVQGKGSSPDAESYERPSEDEHQPATGDPMTSESEDEALDTLNNLDCQAQGEDSRNQADDNISLNVLDNLDHSQQKSSRDYAANKVNLPENSGVASFSDSPTMPTHQKNIPSFDEALGIAERSSEISGRILLLRQESKSRSQISQPLPITESPPQKIAANDTLTVKTKGKVSASLSIGREVLIPEAQPSTSQAPQIKIPILKASKVSKKYAVKPKTPIAGVKELKIKRPGSSKQKGKSSGKGKGKNTKTYQKAKPAPTAVEEPVVAKRSSQRAAANGRDNEPAQPNVSRKRKTAEQPAEPAFSEIKFASVLESAAEEDKEALVLQQQMPSPPRQRVNKVTIKKPPRNLPERRAAVNFASQLDDLLSDDTKETVVEDAKDNSRDGPDADSEELHLKDGNLSQPTQRVEEVVRAIPRETEVKKSEKIITKMDEYVLTADIIDPVLSIPSHSLSISSINSKQEAIHEPVATKASASTDHQTESLLTLQLSDVDLVEEKKRKVATEIAIPPKRRRQIATNNSGSPSISSSGPRAQGNASPESLASKNRVLLDDRSIRKPNFIHFNAKGAQNQGFSGTSIPVPKRDPKLHIKTSNTAKVKLQDMFIRFSKSPRKRQSVSPPNVALPTDTPILVDGTTSPTIPTALKSSSQGSRVDAFGSPQAQHIVPSIGHALRVEQREAVPESDKAGPRTMDSHQDLPEIKVLSPELDAKDIPELFGPRIKVVSIPKARPAPPGESSVRYIPHTKTQNGSYKDISTMENIQEVKVLPDPFVDVDNHKSSGFTERLRAREADGGLNVRFSDPDKTLVEMTEQSYSRESSSPSELSSNSSFRSTGSSNIPRQELSPHSQWSKAVRPHYKGYADTVHKIADEMVIRLTNEEDASELVVRQYKENATSMLEDLSSKRDLEKLNIRQQIENKKTELIRMYSEAGKAVKQIEKDITTSPIGDVDGTWQERQEFIQRELKGGRRTSDS